MGDLTLWISGVTLALGALLGLKGLLDPVWAGKLVRLQAEHGQPEGFAEFRSTLGGMFLGLHLAALICLIMAPLSGGAAACFILAAGWLATAAGRFVAYLKDEHCRHSHVVRSIWIEVVAGALIALWPISATLQGFS